MLPLFSGSISCVQRHLDISGMNCQFLESALIWCKKKKKKELHNINISLDQCHEGLKIGHVLGLNICCLHGEFDGSRSQRSDDLTSVSSGTLYMVKHEQTCECVKVSLRSESLYNRIHHHPQMQRKRNALILFLAFVQIEQTRQNVFTSEL